MLQFNSTLVRVFTPGMDQFAMAVPINYCQLGGLNNRNEFSHSARGQKSEIS